MLRFFRTGDGTLARFNGCGPTPTDALATVLAYDDVEGSPVRSAVNSGYVQPRLRHDAAHLRHGTRRRLLWLSYDAQAGFLSFEIASATRR